MRDALMIYLIIGELAVLLATLGPGMRAAIDKVNASVPDIEAIPMWFRTFGLFMSAMLVSTTWLPFALLALCIKLFGRGK